MDKLANKFAQDMISSSEDPTYKPDSHGRQKDVINPIPHLVPLVDGDGDQSPMCGDRAQRLRDNCTKPCFNI
jgi:hypothetical protein